MGTTLLAQFLGLYFLIVGGILLLFKDNVKPVLKEAHASKPWLLLAGCFDLVIGLLVVIFHSEWPGDWSSLITLLGYLFIARGIIRAAFTAHAQKVFGKILAGSGYGLLATVWTIIGIFLTYKGFIGQ